MKNCFLLPLLFLNLSLPLLLLRVCCRSLLWLWSFIQDAQFLISKKQTPGKETLRRRQLRKKSSKLIKRLFHTHLFDFFHFILCFYVPGVELENHLVIYSEINIDTSVPSNWADNVIIWTTCHLLMQIHVYLVQIVPRLFVNMLWSSCCPVLLPSYSQTRPQHTY